MNCPKCEGYHLKPKRLENGLVTLSCDNCHGSLLSIVQFIQWKEAQNTFPIQSDSIVEVDESSGLLNCPKCCGFMTKYKICEQTHNRLDLCFRCYETWIDSGEWQLLQQLDLHQQLEKIFTETWQNHLVQNIVEENSKKRVKKHFGEAFSRINAFKLWLDSYEKKNDVIDYLKMRKS